MSCWALCPCRFLSPDSWGYSIPTAPTLLTPSSHRFSYSPNSMTLQRLRNIMAYQVSQYGFSGFYKLHENKDGAYLIMLHLSS